LRIPTTVFLANSKDSIFVTTIFVNTNVKENYKFPTKFIFLLKNINFELKIMNLSQEEWIKKFESDENALLLDVRTIEEFQEGHIPNAKLIDFLQAENFFESIKSLDPKKNYYVYCRSGARSSQACQLMNHAGIITTYNLLGGFMEWEKASF